MTAPIIAMRGVVKRFGTFGRSTASICQLGRGRSWW